ncbi:MAG: type IV pilus assembly protein PilM [Candidatus Omnitrophota bacterium]
MSKITGNLFLGIDFGSSGIKIALLNREKGGRLKLVYSAYEPYESAYAGVNGQDRYELIGYLLKNFLRKGKNLSKAKVGISIAGQAAFVRMVKIPIISPRKLRQIVLYETQQQVPFPIKDVVWDFQIYGKDKKQLSILLTAVKKEFVISLLRVINECALDIEFIDVSNLALYNCLQYFYRDLEQTLILDCGAKTTNIIVVNPGKIWTRSLPLGGEDITEAIARNLGINRERAEILKKENGKVLMLYYGRERSEDEEAQKVAEVITGILTDLTNEIIKTLNFYKTQPASSINFKKVLLTGGVSKTVNIDKFFENTLSIPTERINYFNLIDSHPKLDISANEHMGSAIGLTLRGLGRSNLNINLLPQEQLRSKKFAKKVPYIVISLLCVFFALLSCFIFLMNKSNLNRSYLGMLNEKIAAYEQNKEAFGQLESAIKNYQKKSDAVCEQIIRRYLAALVVRNIAEAIPDSVWIENYEMDLNKQQLFLEGRCDTGLGAVSAFKEDLERKAIVKYVKIDKVKKGDNGEIAFSFLVALNPLKI